MIRNGKRWLQKPLLGYGLDRSHPSVAGLAACWVLNEGTGNVFDLAGGANGTVSGGATWKPGDDGPALDFTGASADRVTLSGVPTGSTFTLLARFYQRSQSGYRSIYVDNSGNTGLWLNGGKVDYFQGSDRWPPGAAVVSANTWHTALVITPGAGQNLTYYLDGQLYGTYTNPGGYTPALPSTGNLASHGGEALDGRIGLVYVWTRALSAGEALALSTAPYALFTTPTTWRWQTFASGGGGGGSSIVGPVIGSRIVGSPVIRPGRRRVA